MLAIAGGLAVLGVALFFFMMSRAQPPVVETSGSLDAERAAATPKAKPAAKAKPAPAKTTAAAAKPVVAAKPAPQPEPEPVLPANGLPAVVNRALAGHPLVVVALYVPGARVDELAADEAEAGAKALGIGFVRLNVLDEALSRPLVEKLGVLQNPSVLFFGVDGELKARLEGFVDRQTVAQAAVSASGKS